MHNEKKKKGHILIKAGCIHAYIPKIRCHDQISYESSNIILPLQYMAIYEL
jgi:hypothetical protein